MGSDTTFIPPKELNIADWFLDARIREGNGDRVAVRVAGGRSYTYGEVQALAHAAARRLRAAGIRQEDRVMVALPDGIGFVATFFGVLELGAVVVMVNPDLPDATITSVSRYVRPRGLVVDRHHEAAFRDHTVLPDGAATLLMDDAHGNLELDGRRLPTNESEDFPTVPCHCDDPAIWLFSGGTTGRPKAVVQSHGAFVNTTELYAKRSLGYQPDDITISVPKLFFGYATGSNLLFPFAVGASTVLFPEPPTPETLFTHIREHRPTILISVPTLASRMLDHPDVVDQDLSSLRLATSAGEALPVPVYERWKQTFGVELLDGLGTAEMWHVFLTNTLESIKPGTLGRVVPGFEIRICDDEGQPLPDGEVGRLWVRGRSRALGYWQNHEKSCDAFRGEWFVGGDLVCRDDEGFVTYCGRGDDVMKVAGRWLVPQEVEGCLMRHPAVQECAVIGAVDQAGLTKPYAFVRAAEGTKEPPETLEAALKTHTLERLEPYKHPRRVIVVDDFARTHLGKIDRNALRKLL